MAFRTISALVLLATASAAHAQGYIITQPGMPPAMATPFQGGYMITQPGQPVVTVTPTFPQQPQPPAWQPSSPLNFLQHR